MKKNYKTLELPANYKPTLKEEYMSSEQLAYFYHILTERRQEVLDSQNESLTDIQNIKMANDAGAVDSIDAASAKENALMELRIMDRDNNLLRLIDSALKRLENGTYGYCVVTGEEIGIKRLMARPMATMTVEAQEEHERKSKSSASE